MTDQQLMQLRLPRDLKEWVKEQAKRNGRSQNSEVLQAIRAAKFQNDQAA